MIVNLVGLDVPIDDESLEIVGNHKWFFRRRTFYRIENGKRIWLHREIMGVRDNMLWVCFKNGWNCDHRKSNLYIRKSSKKPFSLCV
jgi:hypothetical protein